MQTIQLFCPKKKIILLHQFVAVWLERHKGAGLHPDLAKEDGHEVVVNEERLGEVRIVEVEEERGEAQRDVVLRRRAEGRAQKLHAGDGDEQSSAAGGKKKKEIRFYWRLSAEMVAEFSAPAADHIWRHGGATSRTY